MEKTRSVTRSLTQEMLDLNKQVIDWNLDANKRFEKQVTSAFEASRSAMSTMLELQQSTTRAWLDLVAPVQVEA